MFLSCHYEFTNYFDILIFLFSNITEGVPEFSFLAFLAAFLNFALKTYCTLKMFLLNAQNNFYVTMSSYEGGHVKKIQVHVFMFCLENLLQSKF